MRKITQFIMVLGVSSLLAACWGSGEMDPRVQQVITFVKGQCGFIVSAASVGAMILAPNPAVQPTVKALGNAICEALNEDEPQVQTFFGWGEDKGCPRVNGVCIEVEGTTDATGE